MRYEQRFVAQERAIAKQEKAYDERFASTNEFRAQQSDVIARFMPRAEAEQRMNQNADRMVALERQLIKGRRKRHPDGPLRDDRCCCDTDPGSDRHRRSHRGGLPVDHRQHLIETDPFKEQP